MRGWGAFQVHLIRGRPPVWTAISSAVLAWRPLAALVERGRHVADLVRQHVLFHVALVEEVGFSSGRKDILV